MSLTSYQAAPPRVLSEDYAASISERNFKKAATTIYFRLKAARPLWLRSFAATAFCHPFQLGQGFVTPLEKRAADVLSVAHGHQPVGRIRVVAILAHDLFLDRPILLEQPALKLLELLDVSDVGL